MLNYIGIYYALLASLFVGLHIYSIKHIEKISPFYIFISFLLWLISRYFVVQAHNKKIDIVLIHAILTCSILVTMILSFLFHREDYNLIRLFIGVLLTIIGILFVHYSIKN
jgi:multidrug transporter EmrE-like cation transporter